MVSANGSAKASEVVWKSMPCLAGFAWLFFSSHSKAMAHYDKRKYICQYNIASAQVCLRFLAFPRSSCHTVFSGTFHISAPHPVPWNSVLQTLPPSLFNAFPLHSNANKRVIGLRCTSMLFSPVFVHSDLRSATHRPRLLSPRPTVLAACPATPHHFRFSPLHLLVLSNFFRINTYKSLSKQTTLTFFRINTYEKHRGEGGVMVNQTPDEGFLSRGSIGSEESLLPPDGKAYPGQEQRVSRPLPQVTSH